MFLLPKQSDVDTTHELQSSATPTYWTSSAASLVFSCDVSNLVKHDATKWRMRSSGSLKAACVVSSSTLSFRVVTRTNGRSRRRWDHWSSRTVHRRTSFPATVRVDVKTAFVIDGGRLRSVCKKRTVKRRYWRCHGRRVERRHAGILRDPQHWQGPGGDRSTRCCSHLIPTRLFTLRYRYALSPPELSTTNPYHLGGPQHSETILGSDPGCRRTETGGRPRSSRGAVP